MEFILLAPKGMYFLFGALITAVISLVIALSNNRNQLKIAESNINKDHALGDSKFRNEREIIETGINRAELKRLHLILSTIKSDNSIAMISIQNFNENLDSVNKSYIQTRGLVHEAYSITGMYYPAFSERIKQIETLINSIWGEQIIMVEEIGKNTNDRYQNALATALGAGDDISTIVSELHRNISIMGEQLSRGDSLNT